MLITFYCSECRTKLEIDANAGGEEVECPHCGASLTIPRKGPGPGTTIGDFKIKQLLGRGGMGEVYLAHQLSMARDVALKILPSTLTFQSGVVDRFLKEVHMQARLEHPNIVTAYAAGEDSGIYFMAMAYVKGVALDRKLMRDGPMPEYEALQLTARVAAALAYAWETHRMLHRDIKPSNIILDQKGNPKLTDMGLSKSLDEGGALTVSEMVLGTPNYMSPEQAEGAENLDFRSDMYSLGATLHHMLTGQVPFFGNSVVEILKKQATEPLPDPREFNPDVSDECVELLAIMLAKRPEYRYATWDDLIFDIDRVLSGQAPSPEPLKPGESTLLKAKDLEGRQHRRMVLTHTQAEHLREHRSPRERSVGKRIIMPLFFLFLVVVALWVLTRPRTPPVPSEPHQAVSQQASIEPESPPGRGPDDPLRQAFENNLQFGKQHPGRFDELERRWMQLQKDAVGTPWAAKVDEALRRFQKRRMKTIENAWRDIRTKAEELYGEGKIEEARALLSLNQGPFRKELRSLKEELLATWDAQAVAESSPTVEEASVSEDAAVQTAWNDLISEVAGDLLQGNFSDAGARISSARQDPALTERQQAMDDLERSVSAVAGMEGIILDSFRDDVGKDVHIYLKEGRRKLRIAGIEGGEIKARRRLQKAGFVERNFTPDDLLPHEWLRRLGREKTPELLLMRGMLAYQHDKEATARKLFMQAENELGYALASQVDMQQADSREENARRAYVNLLRVAKLPPDVDPTDEEVLHEIRRTRFPPPLAGRIRDIARTLRESYAATETVQRAEPLLAALERADHHPRDVDPAVFDHVLKALQRANPQLVAIAHKVDVSDGLSIDLSNNSELIDISPLAGLPIRKLDLSTTKVRDIRSLRGMPLEELNLWNSRVSDITVLRGMPLKILNIATLQDDKDYCVSDLGPLRGMNIEQLDLFRVPVADLTPLKGMALTRLNLRDTPVQDITALRGMPLVSLDVQGTRVSDLSTLRGMPLKELNLSYSQVTSLRDLRNLPLERLWMEMLPLSDLAELEGLPLTYLDVRLCPNLRDFSALAELPALHKIDWNDYHFQAFVGEVTELLKTGQYDKAVLAIDRIVKRYQEVAALKNQLVHLKRLRDEGIPYWRELSETLKNDPSSLWNLAVTHKNHRFLLFPQFATQDKAREIAQRCGGHLAIIRDPEKHKWVTEKFSLPGIPVWLGAQRTRQGWRWDNGAGFPFAAWAPGQPDNYEGKETGLTMISDGRWNDSKPGEELPFLVEWGP